MRRTLRKLQLTYQRSICNWRTFQALMHYMHRRAELEWLIQWATRKHLPGPAKCYQRRLLDEEQRLASIRSAHLEWLPGHELPITDGLTSIPPNAIRDPAPLRVTPTRPLDTSLHFL